MPDDAGYADMIEKGNKVTKTQGGILQVESGERARPLAFIRVIRRSDGFEVGRVWVYSLQDREVAHALNRDFPGLNTAVYEVDATDFDRAVAEAADAERMRKTASEPW